MDKQEKDNGFKTLVVILALLLIGGIGYIVKISLDVEQVEKHLKSVISEKDSLMKSLAEMKANYDQAILENTSLTEELTKERDKVTQLMAELGSYRADLSKCKVKYQELQSNLKQLLSEYDTLQTEFDALGIVKDSLATKAQNLQQINDSLIASRLASNNSLEKEGETAGKVPVSNLQVATFKNNSASDKGSRINVIKVTFSLGETSIDVQELRSYYIQLVDKRQVIAERKSDNIDGKELQYSFKTAINYSGKSVTVTKTFRLSFPLQKGPYKVNLYDKGNLEASTSINLR